MSRLLLVALVLAAPAAPLRAQEATPPAARTLFSTSHRFAVSGLSGPDALTMARWADDVAERLERALGVPLPFAAGEVILLRALPAAARLTPGVEISQGYFDGRLQQKMVVVRPAEVDQEDLLEGLCALLVSRCMVTRQAPEQRYQQPSAAPAWLSVGLAQTLFKELRARNAPAALQLRDEGRLPRVEELLEWQVLPAGRWREKYCCGVLAGWLMAQPDARERWAALLAQLAGGGDVRAAVQRGFLRLPDWPAVEREWDRWVSQQRQILFDVGQRAPERLGELAALFTLQPAAFGVKDTNAPATVTADALIPRHAEPWVGPLCGAVALRGRLLSAGQPPEIGAAAQAVVAFYESLGRAARAKKGFFARGPSTAALEKELAAARQALAALQARQVEQDRYVNAMDRWLDLQQELGGEAGAAAPALPDRAAIQRYLDDVERAGPGAAP